MSKFIVSTSCQHENQKPPPMSFLHLHTITSTLWQELDEFELDFQRKVDFIREQDQAILENEKSLLAINDLGEMLKASTLKIEWELEKCACDMQRAEKMLSHLQHYGENISSDSNILVEWFASSEILTGEINRLKETFAAFNEEAESERPTWKIICSIMEQHVKILEQTENQLNELQDKVDEITRTFNEIKKKTV